MHTISVQVIGVIMSLKKVQMVECRRDVNDLWDISTPARIRQSSEQVELSTRAALCQFRQTFPIGEQHKY